MNFIAEYITQETKLPPYLPYPRFLLKMELTQTAKLLYALLLDRSTLSQKNGWQDEQGRVYIVYPITELADALDKSPATIKPALNELDEAGLLERKRTGFAAPNHLYVKVPPVVEISIPMRYEKSAVIGMENQPYEGQKTIPMRYGKPASNNYTINNLTESQTRGAREDRRPFGRYENIFLSETEYAELQEEYPGRLDFYVERLSEYIASTGRRYENHAATIRRWAADDKEKKIKSGGIPDYSCKEGESL